MTNLQQNLLSQIATGLRRKAVKSCSKWAMSYVVMPKPFEGPLKFKYHPWTKEMHDAKASHIVGKKAAQMGYTVVMMHRAFYTIDIMRESVLYLLPSKTPDATDFSATKFDPLLDSSPHLAELFTDVKNMATKRAGSACLFIRGSNSRSGLKSISVSNLFCDEFDEMPEHTLPLARERMSGQINKTLCLISTPRIPKAGIDKEYRETTQECFFFNCPSCSKSIRLSYENLVITADDLHDPNISKSYIRCHECAKALSNPLDTEKQARERKADLLSDALWVHTAHSDFDNRGFHINQLYSPTISPVELAKATIKAQTNKASEQELHNSKFGEAHEVEGARISVEQIENLLEESSYNKYASVGTGHVITMGVDVGKWLHVEIDRWEVAGIGNDINARCKPQILLETKVDRFVELDKLMKRFQVLHCVIDANPERRLATEFARRFWGFVSLCFYARGMSSKSLSIEKHTEGDFKINVDRTMWIDTALSRFHSGTISVPQDLSLEYRSHLTNIARHYEEDPDGNQIGRYISNGDDHFAHSRTYSEIALPLAIAVQTNTDISGLL